MAPTLFDRITETAMQIVAAPLLLALSIAEANRLMHDYERLDRLSDGALAARRMLREDLGRRIFAPFFGGR